MFYLFLGTLYLLAFVAFLVQKQLLPVLVLDGIETERSSIVHECSEWRLIHLHSWKEGCTHGHIAFCVALFWCLLSLFCQMLQNLHAFLQKAKVMGSKMVLHGVGSPQTHNVSNDSIVGPNYLIEAYFF